MFANGALMLPACALIIFAIVYAVIIAKILRDWYRKDQEEGLEETK